MGRDGAIPEPASGLKKKISYPFQTRLLNLNLIPLGAGTQKNPPRCHP